MAATNQKGAARVLQFRALAAELVNRAKLAMGLTTTFGGRRDMYEALGYKLNLVPADFRHRFDRNAVAARIIEAKPQSTWRGGGAIIEDEKPDVETKFEQAFDDMNRRLKCWSVFQRVDTLAGMGHYAIILIGAPGELNTELTRVNGPDEIYYLMPFSQQDAEVASYEADPKNPRYGRPVTYTLTRILPSTASPIIGSAPATSSNNKLVGKIVHYSRIIHVADGLLDDHINGIPRLQRCWNLLDDLDKVTGGGAEAFWRRADAGMQVDVDPEMELSPNDEQSLDDEIDEYIHKLRRVVRTRGVKMNPLTSQVAGIKDPIDGIMSQISAGTGIPQRILMGSERGQLASTQDDDNWTARITDRRREFAGPQVVSPFCDRLIELGALPKPTDPYEVRWPEIDNLDDVQKAGVGKIWAEINQTMGERVVLPNEIRDRLLDLPPIETVADAADVLPPASDNPIEQLPTAAVRRKRFERKWNCLTTQKKVAYLKRTMPHLFKEKAS